MKKLAFVALSVTVLAGSVFAADASKAVRYPLKDAGSGRQVTLASLKGKYKAIYIDMFAKWCGPCQGEIMETIKLHNQLASKGVAFVGLDVWDRWNDMKQDMQMRGINHSVFHDDAPSPKGIGQLLGVSQIPVVFILDGRTLKVVGRWDGFDASNAKTHRQQEIAALKSLGVRA